jgi:hypothetical protein
MPKLEPCYFVHVESDDAIICSGLHRGLLAPLLTGQLSRKIAKFDKQPGRRYRADILCMNSGQQVLIGEVRRPLAPVLGSEVLKRALILDAGKRLTAKQKREAVCATRH